LRLAILEIIGGIIVMLALRFNSNKTAKTGKLYDELNLTASDYTIYVDISAIHRHEFELIYKNELSNE
jgi:hypothetical protein